MKRENRISFRFLYWLGLGGLAGGILVNLAGRLAGIEPDPSRLYIGLGMLLLCVLFYFADRRQRRRARIRN